MNEDILDVSKHKHTLPHKIEINKNPLSTLLICQNMLHGILVTCIVKAQKERALVYMLFGNV